MKLISFNLSEKDIESVKKTCQENGILQSQFFRSAIELLTSYYQLPVDGKRFIDIFLGLAKEVELEGVTFEMNKHDNTGNIKAWW